MQTITTMKNSDKKKSKIGSKELYKNLIKLNENKHRMMHKMIKENN
jgi:hypothetical protein